jgi:hypothetical protein
MRWAEREPIGRTEYEKNAHKALIGRLNERDHLRDPGVGNEIMQWILNKQAERVWFEFCGSGQGPVGGCCECSN